MPSHYAFDEAVGFPKASPARANGRARAEPYAPSRPLLKIQRAMRRQGPLLALIAGTIALGGAMHAYLSTGLTAQLIGGWLGVGLAVGLIWVTGRELWREGVDFRMLADRVQAPVLGAAPELTAAALRQLAPDARSPLGALAFQPASPFAGAFRDLQEALPNQTAIAFISALPGDGASTAALGAAVSATQQGRHVIVVDCDTRQRGLTKALGFAPDEGVMEACENVADWKRYVLEEPETGLHCIPATRSTSPWRSLISVNGLPQLIEALRAEYDLVILDCPPAMAAAEGSVLARMAERIVVVANWDETPFNVLGKALKAVRGRAARPRTLGVYVNRAPAPRD